MFIGICGSLCAGKTTIAQYLVDQHQFTHVRIKPLTLVTAAAAAAGGPLNQDQLPTSICFPTPNDMLEFVTKKWRENWVTTDINSEAVLETFVRRPFFLLISVDAPLTTRWRRYRDRDRVKDGSSCSSSSRSSSSSSSSITIDEFAQRSDAQLYAPKTGQMPLLARATMRLLNTPDGVAQLHAALGRVDVVDAGRLRPSWDTYFMTLASLAAQRSNCMKRRVGCVVVRDRRVVSTGYNGTPRGMDNCGDGGCNRCNGGGAGAGVSCLCMHAEENALLEAGRERLGEGAVLYCDTCPCLTCSIKMVQVGVAEVVYRQGYSMDRETADVFRAAGVRFRQFHPPDANAVIDLGQLCE